MEIKAFVSDIDKTLTNNEMLLDIDAIHTIRCLEAAGIPVVLVTARDYMTAASLSMFMGACGLVAAENGSVFWNIHSGKSPLIFGSEIRIARGLSVLQTCFGDLLHI